MQTLSELKKALEGTGLPVAYHHYEDEHSYPYIVYEVTGQQNFFADGQVYQQVASIQVDLYTTTKDTATQAKLARIFEENGIPWTSNETLVQNENCYAVSYYFDLVLDQERG